MKQSKIITLLYFCSYFLYIEASMGKDIKNKVVCEYGMSEFVAMELIESIEAQAKFSAKEIAKKAILSECQFAIDKGDKSISIRNGKPRFYEFSNQYNVEDPYFFCRNNAGYKSYLLSLIQKINLFSRDEERKRHKSKMKNNRTSKIRVSSRPAAKSAKFWDCTNPNYYIKTIRRVDKKTKETLVIAWGPEACVPVN